MYLSAGNSSVSRYSGKVLLATIMLSFVCIALTIFGVRVAAMSQYDKTDAQLATLNSPKALKDKPKVGLVRGIVYNPPNSSAVVEKTIVHVGDKIHDVAVVGIQRDEVEFAKDGVRWQQAVLETPHAVWTNQAEGDSCPVK